MAKRLGRIGESRRPWRALRSDAVRPTPGPPNESGCRDERAAALEAVLFAAGAPLTLRKLAQRADLSTDEAKRYIAWLNQSYDRDRSSFRIEESGVGWLLLTRPELKPWLEQMGAPAHDLRLSPPALETLAVVAYRQPICRADIEAVRGVQVGEILQMLLEKSLIRIAGREESLGRPFVYATTPEFLDAFGLRSLDELPKVDKLPRPGAVKAVRNSEQAAEDQ